MGGQDASPIEPSKTYVRLLGRGGVGNIQESKKWDHIPSDEPPLRVNVMVHGPRSRAEEF
jgi:hypothetical protein